MIGGLGREPGRFASPREIALGPDGNLYVADTRNARIQVLDADGRFLRAFGALLKRPVSLALDRTGRVFVADSARDRIQVYSREGVFLFGFGRRGAKSSRLSSPTRVRVGPRGTVYVLDRGGELIRVFDPRGRFLREVRAAGSDFFVRPDGSFFLLDAASSKITVISPNGEAQGRFGGYGSGRNQFRRPEAIFSGPAGRLIVVDTGGKRLIPVRLFEKRKVDPPTLPEMDTLTVSGPVRILPYAAPASSSAARSPGMVYTLDAGANSVRGFNSEGIVLFDIGRGEDGEGLRKPAALVFTGRELLVLDRERRMVFRFGPSGRPLGAWKKDAPTGGFEDPVDMAHDGRGRLYVLDRGRRAVSVFTAHGEWITDLLAGGEEPWSLGKPDAIAVIGSEMRISDAGRGRTAVYRLHWRLKSPTTLTATGDGAALELRWDPPQDNLWAAGFRLERGKELDGPFERIGETKYPSFTDVEALACPSCYYRITTISHTGDAGQPSRPARPVPGDDANRPAVAIGTISLTAIFPANYKAYRTAPVGTVLLTNHSSAAIRSLTVSYYAKLLMASPTPSPLEELRPGETAEVRLHAEFLPKILERAGSDRVQARILVRYRDGNAAREYSRVRVFELRGRNERPPGAPDWAASFVTPSDPAVQGFLRAVRESAPSDVNEKAIDPHLALGLRLWHALGANGLRALPSESIGEASLRRLAFPRDVLRTRAASASSISILLASLLEAGGIATALVEYPDHIDLLFEAAADDPMEIGVPDGRLVRLGGRYWFPVEGSGVGGSFREASRKGRFDFAHRSSRGEAKIAVTRDSWRFHPSAEFAHPPGPGTASSPGPPGGDFSGRVRRSARVYARLRYVTILSRLRPLIKKNPEDLDLIGRLAELYRRHGKNHRARKIAARLKVLQERRGHTPAKP